MKLTSSQQQAVKYNEGPLLIVAGAGTGKTTVLVEKVVHLLKTGATKPENILLLTFTEKAAREMEIRVDEAVPYGYFQMNISTFHAFCDKVLREEAAHIGISPAYTLHSKTDAIRFLKKHIFSMKLDYFRPSGNPHKFLDGIITHFSRLSDEDISPEQYKKWGDRTYPATALKDAEMAAEAKKVRELTASYAMYQKLKTQHAVMDFSDLIYYTLQLLRVRPNIRKQLKEMYTHILVDEFQDTNIAQYELLKLLAPPKDNPRITVVGDDSQSIYKFRGASISNILHYMDDYKNAKKVVLIENFRSTQAILDASYRSITHNNPDTLESRLGISKNLKSMVSKGSKNDIRFFLFERDEEEAENVASIIERDIKKGTHTFSDFAILVRANSHSTATTAALTRRGIPYQFFGPGSLFKLPEVKELISFLYVLNDANDSASLYRLLSMNIFSIPSQDLYRLNSFAKLVNLSLFEALHISLAFENDALWEEWMEVYRPHQIHFSEVARARYALVYDILQKSISSITTDTAGQLLFLFIEQSGLLKKWMRVDSAADQRVVENVSRFFSFLKSFEARNTDASVPAVVEHIQLSMELGDSPSAADLDSTTADAVHVMTVHSAKGLEFKSVFLINLVAGRFPTYNRREQIPLSEDLIKEVLPTGDYHMQEERRLFYVATTRAKESLYLSAAHFYGDGKRARKISPFVVEAVGQKYIDMLASANTEKKQQLTFFDFQKKTTPVDSDPLNHAPTTIYSYSKLTTYHMCPLRYKYQYVLKIPVTSSEAASFGSSVHKVLQELYAIQKDGQKTSQKMLNTLLAKWWSPIGFTSKLSEATMKKKGSTMLATYYRTYHDKNTRVISLEQPFKISISNAHIVGKIDRVDSLDAKRIAIIDYKTGKPKIEKRVEDDLQLSIYAMAASHKNLYGAPLENIVLRYYFLQTNEMWETSVDENTLLHAEKKIETIIKDIESHEYTPKKGPWCRTCPFRINCEAWQ